MLARFLTEALRVGNLQGAGQTTRASVDSSGSRGTAPASTAISADGRFVAFASFASNLVAGDTTPAGTLRP